MSHDHAGTRIGAHRAHQPVRPRHHPVPGRHGRALGDDGAGHVRRRRAAGDTYANERAGQEFAADIDAALAPVRAAGGGLAEALAAVRAALPADAELDGSTVKAEFTADSGRALAVVLQIHADATYSVASWKATTLWTENGAGETLWSGAAQTR